MAGTKAEARTKGCLNRQSGWAMPHQRIMSAKKIWRKPDGRNRLPEIIQKVEFRNGSSTKSQPPDNTVSNFRA